MLHSKQLERFKFLVACWVTEAASAPCQQENGFPTYLRDAAPICRDPSHVVAVSIGRGSDDHFNVFTGPHPIGKFLHTKHIIVQLFIHADLVAVSSIACSSTSTLHEIPLPEGKVHCHPLVCFLLILYNRHPLVAYASGRDVPPAGSASYSCWVLAPLSIVPAERMVQSVIFTPTDVGQQSTVFVPARLHQTHDPSV